MALIKCRECGKEISKTAKTCPNCGAKNKNRPTSPITWLVVIILIISSLGFICNVFFSSKTTSQSTSYQSSEPPPIDVAPGMTPDQLKAATLHLRKKIDEVKNITWYYHQYSPKYDNSRTAIQIYFGYSGNSPNNPCLLIHYVAEDWLFISRYTIKADDASFEISPEYGKIERDNGTLGNGEVGIWEWYNHSMSRQEMEMALAIIKSKKAIIRFEGKQYYKDYIIPQQEKIALKEVLAAYKQMGGVFK